MDVVKVALFGLFATVCVCIVRQQQKDVAAVLCAACGAMLCLLVCDNLYQVMYSFYQLSETAGVDSVSLQCVVKVVGIGYLSEFANGIACDSDCKSIGDKILLAAKIAIAVCVLPVIEQLFDALKGFVI